MVRAAIIPQWEKHVFSVLARFPSVSARQLAEAIDQIATRESIEPPSQRTLGRIKAAFESLPEERRRTFAELHWPDSMGTPDLPWEASAAVLELLRAVTPRPDIGLGHWFWRVTLAASDAPIKDRVEAAYSLLAWDHLGRQYPDQELEDFLVYGPWRSAEALEQYKAAINEGRASRTAFPPEEQGGVRIWSRHTGAFDAGVPGADLAGAIRAMGIPEDFMDAVVKVIKEGIGADLEGNGTRSVNT